jgi:hypothetical protein
MVVVDGTVTVGRLDGGWRVTMVVVVDGGRH